MIAPIPDALNQPFLASDIAGFVIVLIALIFAVTWWRDREPGMLALAVGFTLLGLWFGATPYAYLPGRALPTNSLSLLLFGGGAFLSAGLIGYFGFQGRQRRFFLWATIAPIVALAGMFFYARTSGTLLPRSVQNVPLGLWVAANGAMTWWGARRERGAGHGLIAVILWTLAGFLMVAARSGVDVLYLRFVAFGPLLALMLTLLATSLMRRRRALQAEVARRSAAEADLLRLNGSLEKIVTQRTADLQEIVAGLESFNRNISHDLRGALGGMSSLARMAEGDLIRGDPALALRALPLIAKESESGSRLVSSLLSLARVSDARLELRIVDLKQIAQQVIDQICLESAGVPMPRIELKGFPQVAADPDLVRSVFKNLIGNAVKFTGTADQGHIEIGASSTPAEVNVYVRDNGVGFDANQALRMFKPFERLHGNEFVGHGIGLSIVRRAVERHGGRVWAESTPGQGATFNFSLPFFPSGKSPEVVS